MCLRFLQVGVVFGDEFFEQQFQRIRFLVLQVCREQVDAAFDFLEPCVPADQAEDLGVCGFRS